MKGICPVCRRFRWLGGKGRVCKPCGYPIKACVKCGNVRKIYVRELCYTCFENEKTREKLANIEGDFITPYEYSGYLFALYLQYTRRFNVHYFHVKQTRALATLLSQNPIEPILSWMQIYELEKKYPIAHREGRKAFKGHAFFKIGYMLQELGVLPPRHDEQGRQFQSLLSVFDEKNLVSINLFVSYLRNSNQAETTIVDYLAKLRDLYLWLKAHYPNASLLEVNYTIFAKYLDSALEKNSNPHYRWGIYFELGRFYRFLQSKRLILSNPCGNITLSRPQAKLCVVDEADYKLLLAFIQNPATNPESAILLSVILFFGFTTEDVIHAQISFHDSLHLTLRRQRRTRGRRFYNREQLLKLPTEPRWFFDLQKRFYEQWKLHRKKIKSPYPYAPLLLPHNYQHNRPLSGTIVLRKIMNATRAATGHLVPARILRQTCGHIHSLNQDASLLSHLGWSTQFAFHYTWLPRVYFNSTQT